MKLIELLYRRETRSPMLALTFASAASVALVAARMVWKQNFGYAFLIWNLVLAWMPLVLAMIAREHSQNGARRDWRFGALTVAWLLFLPNAPYIFTDVVHLFYGGFRHFWLDLTLILICAFTGLVLGFVSLYVMQSLVARMFGWASGWLFVAVTTALSGFGIYLGRILRFNTWDVLARPGKLLGSVGDWASDPLASSHTFAFPALFAIFLFLAYVMLYTLTHLPRDFQLGENGNAIG